jgi:hypothetical protein
MDRLLIERRSTARERSGDPELEALVPESQAHRRTMDLCPVTEDVSAPHRNSVAGAERNFRAQEHRGIPKLSHAILHFQDEADSELFFGDIP